MQISHYIKGLRATHFVCVVRSGESVVAVLTVPRKEAEYSEAKQAFVEQVKTMKRGDKETKTYSLSFYK